MGEVVKTNFRGIVKPEERLEYSLSDSGIYNSGGTKVEDITEVSPLAGIPEPQVVTDMGLRASGPQTKNLTININRPGLPYLDGAGYLWRLKSETTDFDYRGCDLPVPMSSIHTISSTNARRNGHLIECSDEDHTILTTYVDSSTTGLYTRRVLQGSGSSIEAEVTVDATAPEDCFPCLLQLPNGRILLFKWADDSAGDWNIREYYSDDYGQSWETGGFILENSLDSSNYDGRLRIRAAYNNGQILILAHLLAINSGLGAGNYRDRIAQFASVDGGATFEQIVISQADYGEDKTGGFPDIVIWKGQFVIGYVAWNDVNSTYSGYFRKISSAQYPWYIGEYISTTASITCAGGWGNPQIGLDPATEDDYMVSGDFTMWIGDDQAIYASGRDTLLTYNGSNSILRSIDGIESWQTTGKSILYPLAGQTWWNTGSSDCEANNFAAIESLGRTVIIFGSTRGGVSNNRMFLGYFGGWQNVTMPSDVQRLSSLKRTTWTHTGCATHLPGESIWTPVVSGVESLTNAIFTTDTTAGGTNTYTYTSSTSLDEGIIFECGLKIISGTHAYMNLTLDDGVDKYIAYCLITATTVQLWDGIGASQIGTSYTYDSGSAISVRVAIKNNTVIAYAFVSNNDNKDRYGLVDADRKWENVASTDSLTHAASTATTYITFGIPTNTEVEWYDWKFVDEAYTGQQLYESPLRLKYPRSLSEKPSYAGYECKLSSISGPAYINDNWDIYSSSEYPIEAILTNVSPSPRITHRAKSYSGYSNGTIRWTFKISDIPEDFGSSYYAILLDKMSFGSPSIYLKYAAAYNLISTVGYWSFTANRYGNSLLLNAGSNANSAVIRRNELEGCLIEEMSGGSMTHQSRITKNSPGYINTTSGTSVPLQIQIEDDLSAWGANPVVKIYPKRALIIIKLDDYNRQFSEIQIRAPHNSNILAPFVSPYRPPEEYYEIGTFAAGPLWVWGTDPSNGHRFSTNVDTELITAEDGTRIAYNRSPARRSYTLSWSEGINMYEAYNSPNPSYITDEPSGEPLAFHRLTPIDLGDQLRDLNGSLTPIIYIPSINEGTLITPDKWANGAMLGRIVSGIERDNIIGNEEDGEFVKIQQWQFEEEI